MSIDRKIRDKIQQMAKEDQLVRRQQWRDVQLLNKRHLDRKNNEYKRVIAGLIKKLRILDAKHTREMKKITTRCDWPGRSLVGKRGAAAAWLLVQHADHDLVFQKKCLILMKSAAPDEVESKHIAYLTDRILVHEGKEQIYGTQFKSGPDNNYAPFPIKDPRRLNKLRKEIGLEPFLAYKKRMRALVS
ncbi:MAG TPA: hypothetical protein DCZ84_01775 [Candidatus Vogelbacteria bacterium]|uniref:Uncharacterized protein n=1 Tax=Candidatus Vogelbacteria bacterium RIFOXYD1_FULL_51_18 TaxID=1802440 RepID=A0A1G2QIV8_9BACT|nr:MAG: hypothetical protein UY66_C0007G0001 [Parcubacteria group bacterium GW2011_GWC1_51_35]OHA60333.1 MAG: hypothetical protein A2569_02430 [Candidatus Vogelbacteria bacterium RIFOXYD1_FULL_51_18]HBB65352.1 hypothetical protein [Candidatus Vogelbacteria bacterium]HCQ92193.1 hypothetical protein [Candidatus Vogelbacteria bacterium]